MKKEEYRKAALDMINGHLEGTLSADDMATWAEKIVVSNEWESLEDDVREAIHALFDLHDEGESWTPDKNELRRHRDLLEGASVSNPQVETP